VELPLWQPNDTVNPTILLAIELSASYVARAAACRGREATSASDRGGDTAALLALISSLAARGRSPLDAPQIGVGLAALRRDVTGFWLHRLLTAHGVASHILEPPAILVNRRAPTGQNGAGSMRRVCCACLRPISG